MTILTTNRLVLRKKSILLLQCLSLIKVGNLCLVQSVQKGKNKDITKLPRTVTTCYLNEVKLAVLPSHVPPLNQESWLCYLQTLLQLYQILKIYN